MSYRSILDASELPPQIERAERESARFGLEFGRLEIGPSARANLDEVVSLVEQSQLDVIVIRYPAEWIDFAAGLHVSSRRTHHADTLMYYRLALDELAPRDVVLPEEFAVRRAGATDRDVLEQLVREMFDDYGSHYRTNPLLSAEDILDGYVDWALRASFATPDTFAELMYDGDGIAQGVLVRSVGAFPELLLGGVRPAASGRGLYTALIATVCQHSVDRRLAAIYISTQAQNLAVQRAWVRLGFRLDLVLDTVHATRAELFTLL